MLKKNWLKIKEYLKKFWNIIIGNDKNWDGKVDIQDDLIKVWNIIIGNDKNWDGKVDIQDDLIKAKEKAQSAN